MAKDVTVIVEGVSGKGDKGAKAPKASPDKSAPVKGVNKKEETNSDLFNRLSKSMTEGMTQLFDILSGKTPSTFEELKETASSIINGMDSLSGNSDAASAEEGTSKKGSFVKASKVVGLNPTDINIVDQQWILGSLLINSTLLRIETLLTSMSEARANAKGGPFSRKLKRDKGASEEGVDAGKAEKPKGKFKQSLDSFKTLIGTMPRLLKEASETFKEIHWKSLFKGMRNMHKIWDMASNLAKQVVKDADGFSKFEKKGVPFIFHFALFTLGVGLIGLLTPFLALSVLAAKLLEKALPSILNVADKIIKENKKLGKFKLAATNLTLGLLALLPGMIALAIMAPFVLVGLISAVLLLPTILLLGLAIKLLPSPVTLLKGFLSAILLTLTIGSLTLSVMMLASLKGKFKDAMIGLGTVSLVALGGALLAAVLGIPVIIPFIALGAVSAVLLTIFFGCLLLTVKMVGDTGKYTEAAIAAMGSRSKKAASVGDDGTDPNSGTGIIGFLSKLASWHFLGLLFAAIGISLVGSIAGGLLLFSGVAFLIALKTYAKIGTDIFPPGAKFADTEAGSGVIGLVEFVGHLTGRIDKDGNRVEGDPLPFITWGDIWGLAPLLLLGPILLLSGKLLCEAFNIFAEATSPAKLEAASANITKLSEVLKITDTLLDFAKDDGAGALGWVIGFLLGDDAKAGVSILMKLFPLLMLGLYGKILASAAIPLQEGIEALAKVNTNGISEEKMKSITDVLQTMMTAIKKNITWNTDEENFEHVANSVATLSTAMKDLMPIIMDITKMPNILMGVGLFNSVIEKLFDEKDQGGFLAVLSNIKSDGSKLNKTLFEQITTIMSKVQPLVDNVITMAAIDPATIDHGIDAIRKLFGFVQEMSGMGTAAEDGSNIMNLLGNITQTMENNSSAKAAQNNPIFDFIDLFLEKLDGKSLAMMESNAGRLSGVIDQVKPKLLDFDKVELSSLTSFIEVAGKNNLGGFTSNIESLANQVDPLKDIAVAFEGVADSLERIAISAKSLPDLKGAFNVDPQQVELMKQMAEASKEVQVIKTASDEYVESIYRIMDEWYRNGVNIALPHRNTERGIGPISAGNGAAY